MSIVDWSRYRKCTGCFAELGKACVLMAGTGMAPVLASTPCGTRKLRAGYARGDL